MNKTAIKNFAIWARNKLIADICYRAGLMGITEKGIADPLPQSTLDAQFYDIGAAEPYLVAGEAIKQRRQLVSAIREKEADTDYATAYQYIMEEVAYTWFNRLIAVRFMEVNDYLPSHLRVLSSESGKVEPDLVTTPFDADLPFTAEEEARIIQCKQDNKLDELFRFLFIKQCNALNEILPGLFEKTTDYTEVLLNLSVVDQEGVVYKLTHDIPEKDFNIEQGGQVEIIGWLYQYYNTEPKAAECQDHKGAHPCRDAAFHAGLDRPLHGGKQPWPPVGGGSPGQRPAEKLEVLSGRSPAGAGGTGKAGDDPQGVRRPEPGRPDPYRPLHGFRAYSGLCL